MVMNWQVVFLSVAIASGYSGGYLWGMSKKHQAVALLILCVAALFGLFVISK
jgi:hypothetical protein